MSGNLAEPGPIIDLNFPGSIEIRDNTYVVASTILFPGSKWIGRPKKIQAVLQADAPASPGDIRIYDQTNAQVIAELTGVQSISPTIHDLGAIANVPNDPAIWEVQIRVQSVGPDDLILYSLIMRF